MVKRMGAWRRVALIMKPGCGPTVQGVLVRRTRREFVLLNAELIEADDRTHALDRGHFEVPRENVYGVQEIQ